MLGRKKGRQTRTWQGQRGIEGSLINHTMKGLVRMEEFGRKGVEKMASGLRISLGRIMLWRERKPKKNGEGQHGVPVEP